jgi:hypothetical protein
MMLLVVILIKRVHDFYLSTYHHRYTDLYVLR